MANAVHRDNREIRFPLILSKEQLNRWHLTPPPGPEDCVESPDVITLPKKEIDISESEPWQSRENVSETEPLASREIRLQRISKASQFVMILAIATLAAAIVTASIHKIPNNVTLAKYVAIGGGLGFVFGILGLVLTHKEKVRAAWDKVSLKVLPNLAKPSQIIGILVTLIGICGCVTAVSGFKIPGLELILQNIPISIVFSLTLIRAGLHMINNGVLLSRQINRSRQEADQSYRLLQIENYVSGVEDNEKANRLKETYRLDQRLPKEYRLHKTLAPGDLYAKTHTDLDPLRAKKPFGNKLPDIVKPEVDSFTMTLEMPPRESQISIPVGVEGGGEKPALSERWSNFWYKHLDKVGKIDMVVGQLMLFTALAGVLLMAAPGLAPPGLGIIAKDPYLSVVFAVLLIGNWINCTRTGWRMLSYKKREEKRAAIEEDLKLIDAGLELRHQLEYSARFEDKANAELKDKLIALRKRAEEALEALKAAPTVPESRFDRFGKAVTPHLATPSIILGILITFFGMACLGMSISGHVPDAFHFLSKNTPLSVLFSSGLLLVGIDGVYRGAALSDFNKKEKNKKESVEVRKKFLEKLYFPEIRALEPVSQSVNVEATQQKILTFTERLAKGWYGLWFKSLKISWVPEGGLGLFLIACSLMGLIMACGAPAPSSLDFIVKDPSYSATFCISMLGIGFDALNTSWRMVNYKKRKTDDKIDLKLLTTSYNQLFIQAPIADRA